MFLLLISILKPCGFISGTAVNALTSTALEVEALGAARFPTPWRGFHLLSMRLIWLFSVTSLFTVLSTVLLSCFPTSPAVFLSDTLLSCFSPSAPGCSLCLSFFRTMLISVVSTRAFPRGEVPSTFAGELLSGVQISMLSSV